MTEKTVFTISDLQKHNGNCSRSWILQCILTNRIPPPDEHIGKGGKYAIWYELHKIAPIVKGGIK